MFTKLFMTLTKSVVAFIIMQMSLLFSYDVTRICCYLVVVELVNNDIYSYTYNDYFFAHSHLGLSGAIG